MFRKKNSRAAAHAANAPAVSSAASTAAVQAFLASRASNSNLSSAAAAAALRSHTASPTNPATIQTKRMQRRLSNSSTGSAASKPTLQRQGSNGSMTERTFRDNSPLRSSSPLVGHPPIPPIPKNLPRKAGGGVGRPASTEPPRRVTSPIPNNQGGRGVSLDRGKVKPRNEDVPPIPKPKLAKIDTVAAVDPPMKRSSVNFSRPMSPTLSPPTSPVPPANGRINKPISEMVSGNDVDTNEDQNGKTVTSSQPKKKKGIPRDFSGDSPIATGQPGPRPSGGALEAARTASTSTRNVSGAQRVQKPNQDSKTSDNADVDTAPKAVRPTHALNKRPSVVKEVDEDDADSEKPVQNTTTKRSTSNPTLATPDSKTTKTPSMTPITASQRLTPSPSIDPIQRHASPSPARNARFSVQPVSDLSAGVRHQPPPRATSPAKSALKHSPSPRGVSPALLNHDISDNVSVTSDEGRRKRKSKVSFEDSPVIVGEAADTEPSKSPFILSPQNKDQKPRFNYRDNTESPEADGKITPIPTLPSFGSIRGRRERSPEEGHKSLYGDEQARRNLAEMTSSSDHAIAGIITADVATKSSSDPLAPEVRSVEGSGYNSDSDTADLDDVPVKTRRSGEENKSDSAADHTVAQRDSSATSNIPEEVPMIAILPATPGHDIDNTDREEWLSGTSESAVSNDFPTKQSHIDSPRIEPTTADEIGVAEPRRESIVEPEPESAQREHNPDSPTVGTVADSLLKHEDKEEESDSGGSVYSDAAEDPVDLEGDGFGSINAIVDSPVVKPVLAESSKSIKEKGRAPDESPSPIGREKKTADWEATKTFWSDVNESTKAQILPEAVGVAVTSPSPKSDRQGSPTNSPASPKQVEPETKPAPRPKKKAPAPSTSMNTPAPETPIPKKSALKKTVRPSSDLPPNKNSVPTMRKSMRDASPASIGNSAPDARRSMVGRLREDGKRSQPLATKPRPQSTASPEPTETPSKRAPIKSIPPPIANGNAKRIGASPAKSTAASQTSKPAPKLRRTMSNDSDSSSSFKRERRSKRQQGGPYSMKRSMRESKPQPSVAAPSTRDQPISRRDRPMSMSGMSLRTTMRETSPLPARPSSVRVASPSGSFFGRRKKAEDKPAFSRKFSDASVESVPTRFASRFRDSSDDDEPLSPVRGIPRRTIEEDSTDLDDSDIETRSPAPAPSSSVLASKSMRPSATPSSPIVTNLAQTSPDKKRKSFFGVLGRKKDKTKIGKSELDSAARRDTPLERTKLERSTLEYRIATPEPSTPLETPLATPLATPLDSPAGSPAAAVRPAKLQRRGTSQRTISESWPLPPPIPQDVPVITRPTTSDGIAARPDLGGRQISSMTNISDGAALGRTGKKKRFGLLRKAFGLDN